MFLTHARVHTRAHINYRYKCNLILSLETSPTSGLQCEAIHTGGFAEYYSRKYVNLLDERLLARKASRSNDAQERQNGSEALRAWLKHANPGKRSTFRRLDLDTSYESAIRDVQI